MARYNRRVRYQPMISYLTHKLHRLWTIKTSFALSLMLLLLTAGAAAQGTVSGTVVDDATGEPIHYATVSPVGGAGGAYTDAAGAFSLMVKQPDSLLITMLGYAPLRTLIAGGDLTYRLRPTAYTTKTVVVAEQRKKARRVKLGNLRASNYSFSGWWKGMVAHRLGASTTESGWLTKVFYRLDVHGSKCSVYARVRLFANDGEKPGEELLTKNTLVELHGAKNRYEVDLKEEEIAFPPGGLYVGIEFLEPGPGCENVEDRKRRFYVQMAQADTLSSWTKPSPGSTWRQLGGWGNRKYDACFGAEIWY